jgi:hypothetical protein
MILIIKIFFYTLTETNLAPLLIGGVNVLHDMSILNEGIPELIAEL